MLDFSFVINQSAYCVKDILVSSTLKKVEHSKAKKSDAKVGMFTYNRCNYESKRESILKKHIITKHEDHMCKECSKNLLTFKGLMKHIAEHH